MHYELLDSPRRTQVRVKSITDMRALGPYLLDPSILTDNDTMYVNSEGVLEDNGGYSVYCTEDYDDVLLVEFEDGGKAVASINGLTRYMRDTNQAFPAGL